MNVKITVEFGHDLDMEAHETVTIVRNVAFYDDTDPIAQVQAALDKFRQHIDASERIPVA